MFKINIFNAWIVCRNKKICFWKGESVESLRWFIGLRVGSIFRFWKKGSKGSISSMSSKGWKHFPCSSIFLFYKKTSWLSALVPSCFNSSATLRCQTPFTFWGKGWGGLGANIKRQTSCSTLPTSHSLSTLFSFRLEVWIPKHNSKCRLVMVFPCMYRSNRFDSLKICTLRCHICCIQKL